MKQCVVLPTPPAVTLIVAGPKPKTETVLIVISPPTGSDVMVPSACFPANNIPSTSSDHFTLDKSSSPVFLMTADTPKPPEISTSMVGSSTFISHTSPLPAPKDCVPPAIMYQD